MIGGPPSAHAGDVIVERFATIELLHEKIRKAYGRYVPSPQLGRMAAVKSFAEWKKGYAEPGDDGLTLVPPDPTSFLTFPTLRQEIDIACASMGSDESLFDKQNLAAEFGFGPEQLDQPTYTLSGGERVRASLMKARLLLRRTKRLVLCAPTQWLHLESYVFIDRLVDAARNSRVPTSLLALEGDEWPESVEASDSEVCPKVGDNDTIWYLEASDFDLPLADFAGGALTERLFHFQFENFSNVRLRSPTVIVGSNGAGKSLLAQCLSGLFGTSLPVRPKSRHGAGPGRLILQDALSHFFREKIAEHPIRVFDFDAEGMKKANALFRELSDKCRNLLWNGAPDDPYLVGRDSDPSTMLQAKLMLVAERLVHAPTLLLLDEPSWGLSRPQARAFSTTVIEYCHAKAIPVLVICHGTRFLPRPLGDHITVRRSGEAIAVAREGG